MHIFFHDGTRRYIISFTAGRDGTFFSARAVDIRFHDGTGRYPYNFTVAKESTMKNTLLSAPRQQCYKRKLYVVHIISYGIMHTFPMGTKL